MLFLCPLDEAQMWVKFVTRSRVRGHGWEGGGLSLCQTVQSFTDAPLSHLLHRRVSPGGCLSPRTRPLPPPPRAPASVDLRLQVDMTEACGVWSTSALNTYTCVRTRPIPPQGDLVLACHTCRPPPGSSSGPPHLRWVRGLGRVGDISGDFSMP